MPKSTDPTNVVTDVIAIGMWLLSLILAFNSLDTWIETEDTVYGVGFAAYVAAAYIVHALHTKKTNQ